jgi:glycosyltransferase involved in cell wall biosynthesis
MPSLYGRSAAMIAPLFGAFGISIKLLEAFRHGIPVVTTPDGAWGLEIETGREAYIESDPATFAARVVELATSPETRARLRAAAYAFLDQHHGLPAAQLAVRQLVGEGGRMRSKTARVAPINAKSDIVSTRAT